jgi:hypothetical protein
MISSLWTLLEEPMVRTLEQQISLHFSLTESSSFLRVAARRDKTDSLQQLPVTCLREY